MKILGISAFYHDSAAALVIDGDICAAAQEERFTRRKHDAGFPINAARYCLSESGVRVEDLDYVAFYDKPFTKFDRLIETYVAYAPAGFHSFLRSMPVWLKQKLFIPRLIRKELDYSGMILFPEHHESHAASAFFPSPYNHAAFVTLDGVGEWTTTSIGQGENNTVRILKELHFPHSLGLLYSAFTYFTGFKVNSGEYKLMGLAPYGEPRYVAAILDNLLELKDDGSFRLNMEYFNYCTGLTMTNARFDNLFGGPPRDPESEMTQREMDLARSIQDVTEEIMLRIVRHAHAMTGESNLCLAGGVALNCVGNGRILREGPFRNIWIQPASGDAGGAVGAALASWHCYLNNPKPETSDGRDRQKGSYLGPEYSNEEIVSFLETHGLPYEEISREALPRIGAEKIADQKVIGWFQGRMEFGPRALGNRSILGDARSPQMQRIMNLKIKFRESFRPFAPSVLRERCSDYFELDYDSPYMLLVAEVLPKIRRKMTPEEVGLFGIDKLNIPRSSIPAVTHVDYSARIQTVSKSDNLLYHELISEFEKRTGCAVIVNTSFNVRGEPIVCTPIDAYRCFMRTEMDSLFLGNCLLEKVKQPAFNDSIDWKQEFQLD